MHAASFAEYGFMIFLVENLVDKYGKGENFVKKCQTCDYEQVIHTSGVHTSVGGSLMVYSEEDKFSCPNCDFEASLEVGSKSCTCNNLHKPIPINSHITK